MEDYDGFRLKRKDLEEVNEDFSDFSLSAPARKIRRLDAKLPPIIEEEADLQLGHEQPMFESTFSNGLVGHSKPVIIEELPSVPENDEKAIVLFKPMNNPAIHPQGNFSVDPDLISSFKNKTFWETYIQPGRSKEEVEAMENDSNTEVTTCKVMIPWVPSQTHNPVPENPASQTEVAESMDSEETEESMMEVEDFDAGTVRLEQMSENSNLSKLNEGLQHQWQPQHHCMIPLPLQNTTSPIVWYR